MNPTLGWILSSEAVWGDSNKTQPLLFHSLSRSSEGRDCTLHAEICRLIQRTSRRMLGEFPSVNPSVHMQQMCVFVTVSYLCDHGKSQDEEGGAADQGEERFVFPQVFWELVRHRGHNGLNGGKLE